MVFVHGNPSSSYMWRNVVPFLSHFFRCLAPDLIGMGRSDVLVPSGANTYRFADHLLYVEALLEVMELSGEPLLLVGHEYGAALAMEWARQHPSEVAGFVAIDGLLGSVANEDWEPPVQELVEAVRSDAGDILVLHDNVMIERYLPLLTQRPLAPREMKEYRRPFLVPGESRRPMLTMMRELPLAHEPGALGPRLEAGLEWLSHQEFPKLAITGDPGFLLAGRTLKRLLESPNATHATIPGLHFLTEDSPTRVTSAIADWLA